VYEPPLADRVSFPEDHPLYQGSLPMTIRGVSKRLEGHDLVVVNGSPPMSPAFEHDGGKRINISQIPKAPNPDSDVSMRSHTLDGPVAAQHASDTDISRDRSRSCIRAVEFKTIRPAES
jgi:hypothetical protein